MKTKLEYIWLDGYTPEPNLRSKIKILDLPMEFDISDLPLWSFDGSSTKQAEGNFSDCILRPVRLYPSFDISQYATNYVLCEVIDPSTGGPHKSNLRAEIGLEDDSVWFGFEQEYVIRTKDGNIAGFPQDGYPAPQGEYYCGVGAKNVSQREFVDMHLQLCLNAGLDITGVNAEVLLGQWEYQLFSKGAIKASDDLWMSRYLLHKVAEYYNLIIDLNPKPLRLGDWNGSGMHCNFSNEKMRSEGGEEYFKSIFNSFESRHKLHIDNYGSENEHRLTGKHETQSMDKFSWGIADRGASIRVPLSTASEWKGYLEDRRPASNADPYRITKVILDSLNFAEELLEARHNMFNDIDTTKLNEKFNGLSNEELLDEYRKDAENEFDNMVDLMESKANIPTEEISFKIPKHYQEDLKTGKNPTVTAMPDEIKRQMMESDYIDYITTVK